MEPDVALAVIATGAAAGLLVVATDQSLRNPAARRKFDAALEDLQAGELQDLDATLGVESTSGKGWFGYWRVKRLKAGLPVESSHQPGWQALGWVALGALVGFFVFPGGVLGSFGLALFVLGGLSVWFTQQARRRVTTMEKQLPLLLSGLSAQLQAGSNIQQALLAVADDLPEPLGDELRIVKQDINVAVPIDVAMRRLSARVPSREMQFLASSIEIAVRSGSNLEPQIRTIEGVVAQRTRLRQKLATAIASVRPTQIIAIAAVPVFFLNSIRDQQNQAFWLSPEALPWIVGIIFFTVFGLWGIRILIKRIETM